MNVFFTTPFSGKSKYQRFIDAIVEEIKRNERVVTPEESARYLDSLKRLQAQGLDKKQAHYAFIRQGIASADVVIVEATEEDVRVGHEMTLALLFHKPTLVLARGKDFSSYITHDLLTGASYETAEEAQEIVRLFLSNSYAIRPECSMQTLDASADNVHAIALAKLRQLAKQEPGQFGEWSRRAEDDAEAVSAEISLKLGQLEQQDSWSVFAPVYNEDSPDFIQAGVAKFVTGVLSGLKVSKDALIAEAACGTAALSRQLTVNGFTKITAFDQSRPMLSEAFRLCARHPGIELIEADLQTVKLGRAPAAIVWADYSSNFALTEDQLRLMVTNLVNNLAEGGVLIFDVRTFHGWQIDFYSQPVTTFATERFQRIWLNHQDHDKKLINFDVYIRTRDIDGGWSPWRRESMVERMWALSEVSKVLNGIEGVTLEAIYRDDFRKMSVDDEEPTLAYFVLRKD